MYWTSTVTGDTAWWSSLTWHPNAKKYAALSTTDTGNDPLLRIWPGAGQAPTDFALTYPGSNTAYGLVDYSQSGWALVGENGSALDPAVPKKPLLMLFGGNGQLNTVSTGLGEGLQLSAIAHLTSSASNTDKHYMIAGSLAPGGNSYATTMWIGELDWSDPGAPKVVRSATCDAAPTTTGQLFFGATSHGTKLARLANGDWVVAGHTVFNYLEFTTLAPSLCRFDANLTQIGTPVLLDSSGGTQQVLAREDGSFWWLTSEGDWLAYTAQGHLIRSINVGWGAKEGVAQGNALWLAGNGDGSFGVSLQPFADVQGGSAPAFGVADGYAYGLVADDSGFALLFSDPQGLHLQHMDPDFHQTCAEATDCAGACADGTICSVQTCNEGVCDAITIQCDDNNECTLDSCADGGCQYTFAEQVSCDDNQSCTVEDSCINGQCTGQSRYGSSTTTVAATETLVDGVVYGDGLLVIGNRQNGGQTQAFWRHYAASREVLAEGMIADGSAVALARYKLALTGEGSFGPADKVAVVVTTPVAGPSLWYLNLETLAAEPGPSLATQDAAMHSLVQDVDGTVLHLTSSPSGWNVYRYVQDQQPTVFLTNAVPDVRDAHLLPLNGDWIVVQVDNAAAGKRALFWRFDLAGGQVGYPAVQDLGPQSLDGAPICPYAARVHQGVQLVCSGGQALYFDPTGDGSVTPMPDTLAVNNGGTPGPLVAATLEAAVSVLQISQDGTFAVFPHDGFFNAGPKPFPSLAVLAPVLAADPFNIWLVTETQTGTTRQVTVAHMDRYGNDSCETSGTCSQQTCEDQDGCTVVGCSAGTCSNSNIVSSGYCGPQQPCSTCLPP
jgi:hypothetical protein